MFKHPWYKVGKMFEMHDKCGHCGLTFEREPGYFYGAMYVSYAMVVGVFLVTGGLLYTVFGDPQLEVYLITVPALVLLLVPLIFRYSRVLFIHLFGGIKYREELAEGPPIGQS